MVKKQQKLEENWKIDYFTKSLFFDNFELKLGGLWVSGDMAWTVRTDFLEVFRDLVLHGMGEVDFHVWPTWNYEYNLFISRKITKTNPRIWITLSIKFELFDREKQQEKTNTNWFLTLPTRHWFFFVVSEPPSPFFEKYKKTRAGKWSISVLSQVNLESYNFILCQIGSQCLIPKTKTSS